MGLARERMNLGSVGLPQGVIATIQSARAPSMREQYDGRWRLFEEWCQQEGSAVEPFQASVKDILSFLQSLYDKGRKHNTVKVYLAAISACHLGFGDMTVGEHRLVRRFMKGGQRLHPISKSVVPSWDLATVLDSLSGRPFEPHTLSPHHLLALNLSHFSISFVNFLMCSSALAGEFGLCS